MEFQVYIVIAIVSLVSFCSLLFISKLPRGKTFDEVLAEKRQLAEKLYGPNYGHKNKTNKKVLSKKSNKKSKQPSSKDIKESEPYEESDGISDETQSDGNNSPAHSVSVKPHVEFVEPEVIPIEPVAVKKIQPSKINSSTKRKNAKTTGSGILVNKSESSVKNDSVEQLQTNNFDEILPKDFVELKHHKDEVDSSVKDLSNEINKNKNEKIVAKDQRKGKKQKEVIETIENGFQLQNGIDTIIEKPVHVQSSHNHKTNEKHSSNHGTKDKSNKKKKTEFDLVQQLIDEREGINVNFLIPLLSKAELTRGEIQILIDFLLNKQQDTITVDHSEWSEGRADVVQKLKKQLAEKEKALQDEQDASAAIQGKLRELRLEINTERAQFNGTIKAQIEEINHKKLENQNLQSEIQYLNDKYNVEKQTITVQMQQMQSKLLQEKKNNSQEILQIEQLNDQINALTNELISKNSIIIELQDSLQLVNDETVSKLNDYENKLRQKDDRVNIYEQELENQRKCVQEFTYRESEYSRVNSENERLRSDLCRKDDYERMFQLQQYEVEKLKQQIIEQSKTQHIDDTSKVEIRNLQNALDSSIKEANVLKTEKADSKKIIDDLNLQINDLKSTVNNLSIKNNEQINELSTVNSTYKATLAEKDSKLAQYESQMKSSSDKEHELFKEIQEFKEKNNDLRTKNWKLNEALQKAESNAVKSLNNVSNKKVEVDNNSQIDIKKIISEEQSRIKQQFEQILPEFVKTDEYPTDIDQWINSLGSFINTKLNTTNIHNNSNSNNICDESNPENDINDKINNEQMTAILLENKNLQDKIESYKILMVETDSVLKNLQKMSEEKEVNYQGIIANQNTEIDNLKKK